MFVNLWFVLNSCQSVNTYQLPLNTVHKISIKGNKLLSTEDIKTNIGGLKESNKSFLFIRLNSYLANKRKLMDSLGEKQSSLQFFKRVPTQLDTTELENIVSNLKQYYRKQGFLKSEIKYSINRDLDKIYVNYNIQEGQQSIFSAKDSILVDNPQLASYMHEYLANASLIKGNSPLSLESLSAQKSNLVSYFRNKGYFYFNTEVVGIHINDLKDSTFNKISLIYKIPSFGYINADSRIYDRVYRIGKLKINETAINQNDESSTWIKKTINSNQLKRIINIKEGDLYSPDKINQSLLNIYSTDQFKTVTHIDKAAWVEELKLHEELFTQLAYHLPAEMTSTKAALAARLEA